MDNVNIKKNKALPFFALLLVVAGLIMGSICSFAEQSHNVMFEAFDTSICFTTPYYGKVDDKETYVFPSNITQLASYEVYATYKNVPQNDGAYKLYAINGTSHIQIMYNDVLMNFYFIIKNKDDGYSEVYALGSPNNIVDGSLTECFDILLLSDLNVYIDVPGTFSYQYVASILSEIGIATAEPLVGYKRTPVVEPFVICTLKGGEELTETGIVAQVLGVFSAIGTWFTETIPDMLGVFYNSESGLTIIGTLAVCSLAIAVILLVLAWILDFFKFRR